MTSRDEIFKEIDQLIEQYPEKLPTDITTQDIIEQRGMSRNSASELMKRLAREFPDKYEMIKVKNETGGWRWVLRRK